MEQFPREIPADREKTHQVRRMFGRIAHRYDFMNRLMTFGQDLRWRKEAIRWLQLDSSGTVLDVGAGTGDIALLLQREYPDMRIVAADLTLQMIARGRKRQGGKKVLWVVADASHLPFLPGVFKGVISGYLLRNVPDILQTLREQCRVLVQGGRLVALDTTPPQQNLLYPFILFYFRIVIPMLGRLLAGDAAAYRYLPDSTEHFLSAERLAEKLRIAGFQKVGFARRMLGTMAIHWGQK